MYFQSSSGGEKSNQSDSSTPKGVKFMKKPGPATSALKSILVTEKKTTLLPAPSGNILSALPVFVRNPQINVEQPVFASPSKPILNPPGTNPQTIRFMSPPVLDQESKILPGNVTIPDNSQQGLEKTAVNQNSENITAGQLPIHIPTQQLTNNNISPQNPQTLPGQFILLDHMQQQVSGKTIRVQNAHTLLGKSVIPKTQSQVLDETVVENSGIVYDDLSQISGKKFVIQNAQIQSAINNQLLQVSDRITQNSQLVSGLSMSTGSLQQISDKNKCAQKPDIACGLPTTTGHLQGVLVKNLMIRNPEAPSGISVPAISEHQPQISDRTRLLQNPEIVSRAHATTDVLKQLLSEKLSTLSPQPLIGKLAGTENHPDVLEKKALVQNPQIIPGISTNTNTGSLQQVSDTKFVFQNPPVLSENTGIPQLSDKSFLLQNVRTLSGQSTISDHPQQVSYKTKSIPIPVLNTNICAQKSARSNPLKHILNKNILILNPQFLSVGNLTTPGLPQQVSSTTNLVQRPQLISLLPSRIDNLQVSSEIILNQNPEISPGKSASASQAYQNFHQEKIIRNFPPIPAQRILKRQVKTPTGQSMIEKAQQYMENISSSISLENCVSKTKEEYPYILGGKTGSDKAADFMAVHFPEGCQEHERTYSKYISLQNANSDYQKHGDEMIHGTGTFHIHSDNTNTCTELNKEIGKDFNPNQSDDVVEEFSTTLKSSDKGEQVMVMKPILESIGETEEQVLGAFDNENASSSCEWRIESVYSLAPDGGDCNQDYAPVIIVDPVTSSGEVPQESDEQNRNSTFSLTDSEWKKHVKTGFVVLERLSLSRQRDNHTDGNTSRCSSHCRLRTLKLLCDLNLLSCCQKNNSVKQRDDEIKTLEPNQSTANMFNTVTQPSTANIQDTTTQPSTANMFKTVSQPSTANVYDTIPQPSTANIYDTVTQPSTANMFNTVKQPSTVNIYDTVTQPSTANMFNIVTQPSTANMCDTVTQPSTANMCDTVKQTKMGKKSKSLLKFKGKRKSRQSKIASLLSAAKIETKDVDCLPASMYDIVKQSRMGRKSKALFSSNNRKKLMLQSKMTSLKSAIETDSKEICSFKKSLHELKLQIMLQRDTKRKRKNERKPTATAEKTLEDPQELRKNNTLIKRRKRKRRKNAKTPLKSKSLVLGGSRKVMRKNMTTKVILDGSNKKLEESVEDQNNPFPSSDDNSPLGSGQTMLNQSPKKRCFPILSHLESGALVKNQQTPLCSPPGAKNQHSESPLGREANLVTASTTSSNMVVTGTTQQAISKQKLSPAVSTKPRNVFLSGFKEGLNKITPHESKQPITIDSSTPTNSHNRSLQSIIPQKAFAIKQSGAQRFLVPSSNTKPLTASKFEAALGILTKHIKENNIVLAEGNKYFLIKVDDQHVLVKTGFCPNKKQSPEQNLITSAMRKSSDEQVPLSSTTTVSPAYSVPSNVNKVSPSSSQSLQKVSQSKNQNPLNFEGDSRPEINKVPNKKKRQKVPPPSNILSLSESLFDPPKDNPPSTKHSTSSRYMSSETRSKRPFSPSQSHASLRELLQRRKRQKLETKYPLPDGVIIKSEPITSGYDLDSNWSVTTEFDMGFVQERDHDDNVTQLGQQPDAQIIEKEVENGDLQDNHQSIENALNESDEPPPLLERISINSPSKELGHTSFEEDKAPPVLQQVLSSPTLPLLPPPPLLHFTDNIVQNTHFITPSPPSLQPSSHLQQLFSPPKLPSSPPLLVSSSPNFSSPPMLSPPFKSRNNVITTTARIKTRKRSQRAANSNPFNSSNCDSGYESMNPTSSSSSDTLASSSTSSLIMDNNGQLPSSPPLLVSSSPNYSSKLLNKSSSNAVITTPSPKARKKSRRVSNSNLNPDNSINCNSGYESMNPTASSSSDTLASTSTSSLLTMNDNGQQDAKSFSGSKSKIQQLKELLKKKEMQVDSLLKIQSQVPHVDLNSV